MANGKRRATGAPPGVSRSRLLRLGRRGLPVILVLSLLVWLGLAVPAGAQDDGAEQGGTPATEEATNQAEPTETGEPEPAETAEAEQTADGGGADDVPAEPSELQAAGDDGEADAAGTSSVMQVAEDLNLRAEPSLEAEVLAVMPAGAEVTVAGDAQPESDFLPVTFDGEAGWAHLAYLLAGSDNLATVVEDLNLRAEPSLEGEVLADMPAGSPVRVFGSAEDADGGTWSKVRFADTTGWAFAEFLASGDGGGDSGSGESAGGEERLALSDLNLRAGPSTDDAVLLVIPAGGSMTLTGEGAENGFVTVNFDGTSGWVAAEFIARPDEVQGTDSDVPAESGDSNDLAGQTRVTLDDLNLRAGASTDDEVLLVIPAGATVSLTGEGVANGFVTVEYEGTTGWAFAELLGE